MNHEKKKQHKQKQWCLNLNKTLKTIISMSNASLWFVGNIIYIHVLPYKYKNSHLHGFEQFPDIRGINGMKTSIFFSWTP